MEQTLQETLYLGEEGDGGEGKGEAPGTNELTDTLTQLQRKLRHSEETHKIELEESKVRGWSLEAVGGYWNVLSVPLGDDSKPVEQG